MKTVFTPIALLARREALGLSQAALAQLLGVTHLTLHRWERDQREPGDPEHVEQGLVNLEILMMNLQDRIYDNAQRQAQEEDRQASIHVFRTDEQWHAVDPVAKEHELPARFYRAAAARASVALRDELGITAQIYTV